MRTVFRDYSLSGLERPLTYPPLRVVFCLAGFLGEFFCSGRGICLSRVFPTLVSTTFRSRALGE